MSQQQDLRTAINNLPGQETPKELQARLDAAGLKIDLSSVPPGEVSETFVAAMSTLLERPLSELTVGELRSITGEVKARSAAPATAVTAETILEGFKKLGNGVIELTLPVGATIEEAGKTLNAAAKEKGMKYPVFYEGNADFWKENEANADLKTEPGRTHRFTIPEDSTFKTRVDQLNDHGEGAPLGAAAIAEACERLTTNGTLLKGCLVRGSAPGVALLSSAKDGVRVYRHWDGSFAGNVHHCSVAFASSVSARDLPPQI